MLRSTPNINILRLLSPLAGVRGGQFAFNLAILKTVPSRSSPPSLFSPWPPTFGVMPRWDWGSVYYAVRRTHCAGVHSLEAVFSVKFLRPPTCPLPLSGRLKNHKKVSGRPNSDRDDFLVSVFPTLHFHSISSPFGRQVLSATKSPVNGEDYPSNQVLALPRCLPPFRWQVGRRYGSVRRNWFNFLLFLVSYRNMIDGTLQCGGAHACAHTLLASFGLPPATEQKIQNEGLSCRPLSQSESPLLPCVDMWVPPSAFSLENESVPNESAAGATDNIPLQVDVCGAFSFSAFSKFIAHEGLADFQKRSLCLPPSSSFVPFLFHQPFTDSFTVFYFSLK